MVATSAANLFRRKTQLLRSSSVLRSCIIGVVLMSGVSLLAFQFKLATSRQDAIPWVKEVLKSKSGRETYLERVRRIIERQLFRNDPDADHEHNDLIAPGKHVPGLLPWFMINGSVRPTPSSKLSRIPAIWPDERRPGQDRIVEQLMYLPPHYSAHPISATLKKISLQGTWDDFLDGQRLFVRDHCPVNACEVYKDDTRLHVRSADAIIFKDFYSNTGRDLSSLHQIWILYLLENPLHTAVSSAVPSINWTATYRKDSDIVTPYEKFVLYDPTVKALPLHGVNYARNKTKMVAWFVSNCATRNDRLGYANQLQNYIQVDIYGQCGQMDCPRQNSEQCLQMLDKEYRFYLAFENANCKDYITEKLYNALRHNVVPVVMGASREEYRSAAPFHSYIHVDDFASPRDLAEYLQLLGRNETLYNEFFRWKRTGEFVNTYFWCRLCALLHSPQAVGPKFYPDIGDWWHGTNVCSSRSF